MRAGAGSVRDSLSVLDQLLGGAGEEGVSYSQAAALLGYTPTRSWTRSSTPSPPETPRACSGPSTR
ncbi:hypothetical protein G7085_14320 [Tessaracoccus sp. HDW20]|nr:hypothetical protein [Tessaracoccus coleopterorum]